MHFSKLLYVDSCFNSDLKKIYLSLWYFLYHFKTRGWVDIIFLALTLIKYNAVEFNNGIQDAKTEVAKEVSIRVYYENLGCDNSKQRDY